MRSERRRFGKSAPNLPKAGGESEIERERERGEIKTLYYDAFCIIM